MVVEWEERPGGNGGALKGATDQVRWITKGDLKKEERERD